MLSIIIELTPVGLMQTIILRTSHSLQGPFHIVVVNGIQAFLMHLRTQDMATMKAPVVEFMKNIIQTVTLAIGLIVIQIIIAADGVSI